MSDGNEQIAEEAEPVQPAVEAPLTEEPTGVESPKSQKPRKKGKRAIEPEPATEAQLDSELTVETENGAAEEIAAAEPGEVAASEVQGNAEPVEAAEQPVAEPPANAPRAGKSRKKGKRAAQPESSEEAQSGQDAPEDATDVSPEAGTAEEVASEAVPEGPFGEEEGSTLDPVDDGARHSLPLVVEAILFASQKPMSAKEILSVLKGAAEAVKDVPDAPAKAFVKVKEPHLREAIESLEIACAAPDRAYEVRESAAGWQLVTKPQYSPWLRQLFPEHRSARLSAPAMETLAIIAYRQPITRADIEAVRGVAVDGVMQTLLDRGLVKIAGRADVPGRPLLYDTTQNFMEHFGLKNLDDLPNAAELRKISLPTAEPPPADAPAKTETPATPVPPAPAELPASPEATSEAEPEAAAEAESAVEAESPEEESAIETPAEPEPEPEISETPVENSPEASDEESRTEN